MIKENVEYAAYKLSIRSCSSLKCRCFCAERAGKQKLNGQQILQLQQKYLKYIIIKYQL